MKPAKKTPHHPKLRHHKPTGQALVELCGRRFYLGRYGKPETEERYHRLVAEWLATGLRRGRTAAKEPEPVRPVPDQHIEAVRPHASRQVWALVRLQLLTGARGGETSPNRHRHLR